MNWKVIVYLFWASLLMIYSCTTNEINNKKPDSLVSNSGDSMLGSTPFTPNPASSLIGTSPFQCAVKFSTQFFIRYPFKIQNLQFKINFNNYFNDFASLISGIPNPGSKYNYLLESDSAWKRNAAYLNISWHSLDTGRLEKISKWKDIEFPAGLTSTTTVFYPFSGPDFLTAFAFFPNMDTIVMLGLEKVGRFPEMEKMTEPMAENYALDLKSSLADIFNKSYFITQHMQRQLTNQRVNGILPVIAFFMERTGNKIADVNYIILKHDSTANTDLISEVGYDYKGNEHPFGVKINYLHANKLCTAWYYRYNVANSNFAETSAFYLQLNQLHNFVTYMKSASYLLQNKTLSNMRDLILKKSNFILQDDTGEPFSCLLKDNKWNLKIYGQYTTPVKDFPYMYEDKLLKKAVADNPSKSDLPFHLGYHWGNKKDLLILASKK